MLDLTLLCLHQLRMALDLAVLRLLQCSIFVSIEFDCEFLSLSCEFLITSMIIVIVNSESEFLELYSFYSKMNRAWGQLGTEGPTG
jgi:hypothetical protein